MRCDVDTIDGFSDVSASQNLQNVGLENSPRAQNFVIPNGMLVCIRFHGVVYSRNQFPTLFSFFANSAKTVRPREDSVVYSEHSTSRKFTMFKMHQIIPIFSVIFNKHARLNFGRKEKENIVKPTVLTLQ